MGLNIYDNWLEVVSSVHQTGYSEVTVQRRGGAVATFPAGTAVVNYGPAGDSAITIAGEGTPSPRIDFTTHQATFTADALENRSLVQTLLARFGNLDGSYGLTGDVFGIGIGDYTAGNYLRYDSGNGFLVQAGSGGINIDAAGIGITVGATEDSVRAYRFTNGTDVISLLFSTEDAGLWRTTLKGKNSVGRDTTINIRADRQTSQIATVFLAAAKESLEVGAALSLSFDGTNATLTIEAAQGTTLSGAVFVTVDGTSGGYVAGATSDVQWYRSAANTWRTPDSVTIDGALNVGSATGAAVGIRMADSSGSTSVTAHTGSVYQILQLNGASLALYVSGVLNAELTSGLLTLGVADTISGELHINRRDAGTATGIDALTLRRYSSGTPAAGLGVQIQFAVESTAQIRTTGYVLSDWVNATDATREGRLRLYAEGNAGAREVIRIESGGAAAMLSFFAVAAVTRAAAYTQTYSATSKTVANITAVDPATYGAGANGYSTGAMAAAVHAECIALRADIVAIKNNITAIIDDLQAYGLMQ